MRDLIPSEASSLLRAIRAERRSITLPPVLRSQVQFRREARSKAGAAASQAGATHIPLRSPPPIPGAPGAGGGRGSYEGLRPLFLYVSAVVVILLALLVIGAGVGR